MGFWHAQEVLLEVFALEHTLEGGVAAAEPLMEEEEEYQRRGSSLASGLEPWGAPVLEEAMPTGPRFWLSGQGIWVARWGPHISAKAWGKMPAVEPLPPEMDEDLAWLLQW